MMKAADFQPPFEGLFLVDTSFSSCPSTILSEAIELSIEEYWTPSSQKEAIGGRQYHTCGFK